MLSQQNILTSHRGHRGYLTSLIGFTEISCTPGVSFIVQAVSRKASWAAAVAA